MDALGSAIARLPDDRLTPVRNAAFAHLREHGLPTKRDEDWKYTDLAPLVGIGNQWLDLGGDVTPQADTSDLSDRIQKHIDADWLLISNGQVDANQCRCQSFYKETHWYFGRRYRRNGGQPQPDSRRCNRRRKQHVGPH
jgi:hypothetical protein